MAKQRKAWNFNPAKKSKSSLPGTVKNEVDTKAKELRVCPGLFVTFFNQLGASYAVLTP
jgi:hypothetical protein